MRHTGIKMRRIVLFSAVIVTAAVATNHELPQCAAPRARVVPTKYIPACAAPGNLQFALEQDFEGALQAAIEREAHVRRWQEENRKRQEANRRRQEERRKEQEERRKEQQEESRRTQEEQQRRKQYEQQQNNKKKGFCPYRTLGVGMDATPAEVKKAYRKKALEMHPDKVKGGCDEACHARFTELVDSYEILSDEDRRAMHDNETFGAYQSRPHHYDSTAGFYSGTSLVTPLNQTEFDRLVLCKGPFESEREEGCVPFMVKFYAPWCVHCKTSIPDWKRAASILEGTETPLGFIRFAAVNCEVDKLLCQRQGIRSFPSIHLYVHDENGQEHLERFSKGRSVENFVEHAKMGVRLALESKLRPIDGFIMSKNVTNSDSTGLWIVMYEDSEKPSAASSSLKAALRRISANMLLGQDRLVNFGILDCAKNPNICREQYVDTNKFPVLKMYPYKGSKGTGETLVESSEDPLVVLPIVEKVVRMCLASIETENGLMRTPHEDYQEEEDDPPPPQRFQYPQPEQKVQRRVLPAGVKAASRGQFIAGA